MSARSGTGHGRRSAVLPSASIRVVVAFVCSVMTLVLGFSVGPSPAHAAARAARAPVGAASPPINSHHPAATGSPLVLRLSALSPTVATPGEPVSVRLSVTNRSATDLAHLRIEARLGRPGSLLTRAQVQERATDTTPPTGDRVVAGNTATAPLAPQASRIVELTIPGDTIAPGRSYGTLPLTFTATAGTNTGLLKSYLPFQSVKEYEPLSVAFAVPLTLDADPTLISGSADAVRRAWTEQLASGSRLDRILDATASHPVTWAVDPTVIGAGDPTSASTNSTGAATATGTPSAAADTATDPVASAQRDVTATLRAGAASHPIWELPAGDPDLSALLRLGVSGADLARVVRTPTLLAERLGRNGTGAPARIAWPVGSPTGAGVEALRSAYGGAGPAAVLAPSAGVDPRADITGPSGRRSASGQPLLTYDSSLSTLFASAHNPADATQLRQRFLAETMALLGESPGRARTVFIAAPRDYDPDVAATATLFDGITSAPWLQTASTNTLLSSQATRTAPLATVTNPVASSSAATAPSPLTADAVKGILASSTTVQGLAQVLSPSADSAALPDTTTVQALLSARWRAAPSTWSPLVNSVEQRLDALTSGVSVQPSTINFFAEHGVVQVTVVNDLDVEVHDVTLVLDPQGRPPRLRVTQAPAPLTIRPKSRVTVRVGVDAVAAGLVPVTAHLATPSGVRLGTDATVRMRVQPTNGWVMLALGGLAGIVFVAGLYRALRAGSPRVTPADLKDIDLQ